jgi:hypothetical protein
VVAAELALSVRAVTKGCLEEMRCRIWNISTYVIAAVLVRREQSNSRVAASGGEVVVYGVS